MIDRLLLENALAIYDHNGAIVKDDIIGAARAYLQLLQSVNVDDAKAALLNVNENTWPSSIDPDVSHIKGIPNTCVKTIVTLLQAVAGVQHE